MPKVKQKVIVYGGGIKKPSDAKANYQVDYAIKNNLRKSKFVVCNKCNNKVTVVEATGKMRTHRFKRSEPLLKCLERNDYRELEDAS